MGSLFLLINKSYTRVLFGGWWNEYFPEQNAHTHDFEQAKHDKRKINQHC